MEQPGPPPQSADAPSHCAPPWGVPRMADLQSSSNSRTADWMKLQQAGPTLAFLAHAVRLAARSRLRRQGCAHFVYRDLRRLVIPPGRWLLHVNADAPRFVGLDRIVHQVMGVA